MFQASTSCAATFELGGILVHQLYDGLVQHAPAHGFFGVNVDDAVFEAFSRAHHVDPGRFDFPATITLVEVEGRRILVDAGHGRAGSPAAGHLPNALESVGITSSSIDTVILSHLHGDHIGGLLDESGRPLFDKARHLVRQSEYDHWVGTAKNCKIGQFATTIMRSLGDQLSFVELDEQVARGVHLLDTAGHTPGHLSVALESQGKRLVVAGDLTNHPVWSVMRPDWHMSLDWDGPMAARSRSMLLGRIADEGALLAGYHMPFPAIGRIERFDDSFRYVPVAATVSTG